MAGKARTAHRLSIFSQRLDRAILTGYFLGAIVPLVALAFVALRYVVPALRDEPVAEGLLGGLGSVGILTLGSFLLIRRTAQQSLQRMDSDNSRLQGLLDASAKLASAKHANDVAGVTAAAALSVTGSTAGFVWMRPEKEGRLSLIASANGGQPGEAVRAELEKLAELVAGDEKPVVSGASASMPEAIVVPLVGLRGAMGALGVVYSRAQRASESEVSALMTLSAFSAIATRNTDLQESQQNFFTHVTEMLVAAFDAHCDIEAGHARRVARIANRIARVFGFSEEQLHRLHFAALLHDVGMLKIKSDLHGVRAAYEKHPALGAGMLSPIRLWAELAPFVLHHHEWFDGTGYPQKLAGEDIPLEARIIAVAEAFDTMTSRASDQQALAAPEALSRIQNGAGTQFDPKVVQAFLDLVQRGEMQLDQAT
ncbi:MAG TPA: HD domain-containing phosphohydrolase [Myxococcota bacterium]|nr:HD domain-containing phosphohydrolase [Myxococcota bacterium]